MKTLKLFVALISLLALTACGSPDVPSQDDIEAEVNKKLKEAGLDPVDVDELAANEDEEEGDPIELSGETKELDKEVVTAGEIWTDVEVFAKELHPGSILIGFNNHSTTFSNKYILPKDKFTDGKGNFWIYFFAKDQAAISDEKIDEKSEAFGVVFSEGELSYASVEVYPDEISAKEIAGEKWFGVDTDVMAKNAKEAVMKDFEDVDGFLAIDFDCIPTWPITFATGQGECDMTIYETETTGFAVLLVPTTGQVTSVESVSFQEI